MASFSVQPVSQTHMEEGRGGRGGSSRGGQRETQEERFFFFVNRGIQQREGISKTGREKKESRVT